MPMVLTSDMAVMDVVVPCDCGSRFSFAVEPVNERLPVGAELACPTCGKDGVPLANRVIGENLRKLAREQTALQPATTAKKSWLKRDRQVKEPEPSPHAYPTGDVYSEARAGNDPDIYSGPNKLKGMLGAVLGGLVGAATWAGVVYWSGYEIKYVAILVGALAGLGSRKIGGGRDYHLGLFAATCALVAILLGQFVAAKIYITNYGARDVAELQYKFQVAAAKEAVELKTDDEFKEFIAASEGELFETVAPETITAKQLADFKAGELPKLRKLASGETTEKMYVEAESKALLADLTVKDIFNASITPYLFFWVFVGVGAAWKLASDYGTSVE